MKDYSESKKSGDYEKFYNSIKAVAGSGGLFKKKVKLLQTVSHLKPIILENNYAVNALNSIIVFI